MRGPARVFGASRLSDSLRINCVVAATYALPIAVHISACLRDQRSVRAWGKAVAQVPPSAKVMTRTQELGAQVRGDFLMSRIPCPSTPAQRLRCVGFPCTYKYMALLHRRPIGRIPEGHPPGFNRHPRSTRDGTAPLRRAAAMRSPSCIFSCPPNHSRLRRNDAMSSRRCASTGA